MTAQGQDSGALPRQQALGRQPVTPGSAPETATEAATEAAVVGAPAAGENTGAPSRSPRADTGTERQVPEPQRTGDGHRLPTTTTNPALQRLAQLAAHLLGAPAAQVWLLTPAQSISAAAGQDLAVLEGSGALADSLCALTAGGTGPLLVQDVAADARVAHLAPVASGAVAPGAVAPGAVASGAVASEAVGACLGVPLVGQDGHVVGAVCVFAPAPRTWSSTEASVLGDLAAAAVTGLELSALSVDHEAERLRWQLSITAGGIGSFDWDLLSGTLTWDERLIELFGYGVDTGEEFTRSIEAFNARVHPEDLPRVSHALQQCIATCGDFRAEYRVVRPDGSTRWVQARGTALADQTGTAVRLLGAAYDTTAAREGEVRTARVLESMTSAFYSLDASWRFSYVNAEAEKLLQRGREQLLGEVVWQLFPATVGSVFEEQYRRAVSTGEPATFEAYYPPPLDGWYEVRAWPGPGGLSVYFADITERRRAQQQLEAAREQAEAARREAEAQRLAADRALERAEAAHAATAAAARRLQLIVRVSEDLAATLDVHEAVARLAQHLVPALADWCLVTLIDEHGALRDVGCEHADPAHRELVRAYREARLGALMETSFLHQVWRSARPVSIASGATDALREVLRPGSSARELIGQLAPQAFECLPLRARGRTVGLVSLFHDSARGQVRGQDLLTALEVADRAGLALDNAALYSAQHRIAEGLQRSLLTAPVEPDHVQVVVRYQPAAQAAQVGGDWYDAFLTPDGATLLVIGDVMGHDVAAAAAMSQVRSLLRGIAYATGVPPAQVLSGLDAAMAGLAVQTTATAIVARLEQDEDERRRGTTRLRWANAGHPDPLLLDPEGTITSLAALPPQLLLGIDPATHRADAAITLDRGSTVLLFTDGLIERRGRSMEEGLVALHEAVAELHEAGADLDELVDGLLARLVPEGHDDDVALVAVRLHPHDRPRPAEAGPNCVPPHPAAPTPAAPTPAAPTPAAPTPAAPTPAAPTHRNPHER